MPKNIYMPVLGMNQDMGTLLRWFKDEGDTVSEGEPLMEVATDKTDVEIEAPASGTLANVTAQPGDDVPVGQVIALILAPGEEAPPVTQESPPATARPEPGHSSLADQATSTAVTASPVAARMAAEHGIDLAQIKPAGGRVQKEEVLAFIAAQETPQGAPTGRTPASPKARRLAAEADLDLAAINGSGPDGAVLAADVLAASEKPPLPSVVRRPSSAPPVEHEIPTSRMWQVMAQRLTESWQTVPHFYLEREVDAGRLVEWRGLANTRSEVKISYTDLLVKLVATALRRHPRVNASWRDGAIIANPDVNVGLAVAVEDGLLVPVIQRVDELGLQALAQQRSDLVTRAQNGELALADLENGTFTISNLGMYGVDSFNAIVNPPQAAILAVGRIVEKVVPVDGQPGVRPTLALTLSCDHRAVDGARAASFLTTLADLIEEPLAALE